VGGEFRWAAEVLCNLHKIFQKQRTYGPLFVQIAQNPMVWRRVASAAVPLRTGQPSRAGPNPATIFP
jgi:hypothetical protein